MAYNKHTWKTDELITDVLLNNMEDGIEAVTNTADNAVPKTLTINGKALSANITLDATDVGAVPTTRKVNNKALSEDITLTTSDLGAVAKTGDTMTGPLNVAAPISSYHSTTPSFAYKIGANDSPIAESAARAGTRALFFREYASDTEYHEDYLLPQPDSNLIENGTYSILTTKGSYTMGGALNVPEISTVSSTYPAYWYKTDTNSNTAVGYHGVRMSDRRFVIAYRNAAGVNQNFSLPVLNEDTNSTSTWYDILTTYNISATRTTLDVYSKSEVDALITGGATPSGDYLPISGGNITNNLTLSSTTASLCVGSTTGGAGVRIFRDGEGGNIALWSPNGTGWQMDAYYNTFFRLYYNAGAPSWLFMNDGSFKIQGVQSPYIALQSNIVDITSSTNNITGNALNPALTWLDKNGTATCGLANVLSADGSNAFYIYIQNRDGSNNPSGLRGIKYTLSNANVGSWVISDAVAFRSALSIGSVTDSNVWLVNTSRTANTVLAAPNGSAGSASFRALVAADIPALAASKITSGTLGVARGGTGAASFTANSVIISGSSTTAALTTRAIRNNTSKSNCGYTNTTGDGLYIPTVNTLAFWDGSYDSSHHSNITYTAVGELKDMATKSSSNYLATSGGTLNGAVGFKSGISVTALNTTASGDFITVRDNNNTAFGYIKGATGGNVLRMSLGIYNTSSVFSEFSICLNSSNVPYCTIAGYEMWSKRTMYYSSSVPAASSGSNGDICFVPA